MSSEFKSYDSGDYFRAKVIDLLRKFRLISLNTAISAAVANVQRHWTNG